MHYRQQGIGIVGDDSDDEGGGVFLFQFTTFWGSPFRKALVEELPCPPQMILGLADMPDEVEEEPEAVFRNRVEAVGRDIADGNALLPGVPDVDVVVACCPCCYQFQGRESVDDPLRDRGVDEGGKDGGIAAFLDDCVLVQSAVERTVM